MFAQITQRHPLAHQFGDGVGHQNLAAMAGGHQASSAVHRGPEVVAVTLMGVAGVNRHANAQSDLSEPPLGLHRGRQRLHRRRESRRERIPRR